MRPAEWLAVLLAFLAALFIVFSAKASCNTHQSVADWLAKEHNEVPVAMALVANGSVMEVYASPEGTWTIALTDPAGVTCLLASGEGWELLPPKHPEVES